MPVVNAVPMVTVSAPVPPVTVSTLLTVAELVPLARVSVSLPAPRSIEAFVTPPVKLIVSSPDPEISVSTPLIVAVFAELPSRMIVDTADLQAPDMPGDRPFCPYAWRTRALARTEPIRRMREDLVVAYFA
jgi:hypothetical protein